MHIKFIYISKVIVTIIRPLNNKRHGARLQVIV